MEDKQQHHDLGASTCERWWNCAGSKNLIKQLPAELKNESTEYSVEGTIAHAVASSILENVLPENMLGRIYYQDGFRVEVSEDMLDAVQVYIDFIENEIQTHDLRPGNVAYEQRLSVPGVGFGTSDASLVVPFDRIISPDYKHGAGIKVDAYKNKQAMYYAFAAYLNLPEDVRNNLSEVDLIIVQPRCFGAPVSKYTITTKELEDFGRELVERAQATCIENAPLNPGPWCNKSFCPAQAVCPALKLAVMEAVGVNSLGETISDPLQMTPEQLADALEVESMVKSWAKNVSAYALRRAENGTPIPGWKIVTGRTNRSWADETLVQDKMKPILGDRIYGERSVLSVAQMEKVLKKEKLTFNMDELISKKTGNKTLARESDKRVKIAGSNNFDDIDESQY